MRAMRCFSSEMEVGCEEEEKEEEEGVEGGAVLVSRVFSLSAVVVYELWSMNKKAEKGEGRGGERRGARRKNI